MTSAGGAIAARTCSTFCFLGLLAGFAVKVPLFPVHTWLPLAHTEAPTAGSVILAGVLLKLGTYGLLRFALPVLPDGDADLCAVHRRGLHRRHHLRGAGLLGAGGYEEAHRLFVGQPPGLLRAGHVRPDAREGITGSVLYMINHGLSTGALFLVVGMIYERYHTRDMNQLGGLARRVPALAFFCVFFVLSSVALPGLNGFVCEFLVLLGTFRLRQTTAYGNPGPGLCHPGGDGRDPRRGLPALLDRPRRVWARSKNRRTMTSDGGAGAIMNTGEGSVSARMGGAGADRRADAVHGRVSAVG